MDLAMLATEKEQLLSEATVEWPQLEDILLVNMPIIFWSPKTAESAYLAQFKRLKEILDDDNE